jgi:MerR family mercuric resistance operon transcriptional regulator
MAREVSAFGELTTGKFAEVCGCDRETIRYYERIGLIPHVTRAANGYRVYGAEDVKQLKFVLHARQLGFSVEEIRSLVGLGGESGYTCMDVQALTEKHLCRVREKTQSLKVLEKALKQLLEQCEGTDAPKCKIVDALFE